MIIALAVPRAICRAVLQGVCLGMRAYKIFLQIFIEGELEMEDPYYA